VFWRPKGCVAWYDFATLKGDVLYDQSGYDNHGKIIGPVWKRGPLIGCLEFDGVDDYARIPDAPVLRFENYDNFAFELLFMARSTEIPRQFIVQKRFDVAGRNVFELALDELRFTLVDEANIEYTTRYSPIEADKWYYVVGMWTGVDNELYVNDVMVDKLSCPRPGTTEGNDVLMGCRDVFDRFFRGCISTFRMLNRTLIRREISAHHCYLSQRFVMHPPLVI